LSKAFDKYEDLSDRIFDKYQPKVDEQKVFYRIAPMLLFIIIIICSLNIFFQLNRLDELKALKRPIYTICNDGWRSYSYGQGTCSWHGGIKSYIYFDIVTFYEDIRRQLILPSICLFSIIVVSVLNRSFRTSVIGTAGLGLFAILYLVRIVVFVSILVVPLALLTQLFFTCNN
jgi:hypothetical protein